MLARSTLDRVSARRGDTDWPPQSGGPGDPVLVLDNARALVRFGDKEAGSSSWATLAGAPEGLRFLLGEDDAGVAIIRA